MRGKVRAVPLPIKVFVEGGAKGNKALTDDATRAFNELIYRGTGARVHIVACGPREAAFDRFRAATGCRPLLLVDSEAPVADIAQPWAHLSSRDGWDQPAGATDDHAHLMTQVMETWLLADPVAFEGVVHLEASRIPPWPALEHVAKVTLHELLVRLTGLPLEGGRGSFKSKAFAVLANVQAEVLEAKCPSAKRLFDAVRRLTPSSR